MKLDNGHRPDGSTPNYRLANEVRILRRCIAMQRWTLAKAQARCMAKEGIIGHVAFYAIMLTIIVRS